MSSPALPPSATSPTQSRPILDPLAFDNVRGLAGTQSSIGAHNNRNRGNGYDAEEAEEDNGDEGVRRARRGPTGINVDDIPRVKDTTGEMVMESFALFLEKSVDPPQSDRKGANQ
jgi:DNA replication licensing factor MCM6